MSNNSKIIKEPHSSNHLEYLRFVKNYNKKVLFWQIGVLVGFLVLWEVAASFKWIDPFFTSKPTDIATLIGRLAADGSLFKHTFVSVTETLIALGLGTILGTIIATMLWWSDFVAKVLDPYLVVLNALPKIALGPIIIIWAGAGMSGIIVTALTISLVVTILSTYNGFREVDTEKIKMLTTFGATKFQILQKVVFPASIPTMINTFKINIGMAWIGVIVGEFLVSKSGLGYLIVYGGQVFRLDIVMAGVIILAFATAIMYQLISLLENKFLKWRQ